MQGIFIRVLHQIHLIVPNALSFDNALDCELCKTNKSICSACARETFPELAEAQRPPGALNRYKQETANACVICKK